VFAMHGPPRDAAVETGGAVVAMHSHPLAVCAVGVNPWMKVDVGVHIGVEAVAQLSSAHCMSVVQLWPMVGVATHVHPLSVWATFVVKAMKVDVGEHIGVEVLVQLMARHCMTSVQAAPTDGAGRDVVVLVMKVVVVVTTVTLTEEMGCWLLGQMVCEALRVVNAEGLATSEKDEGPDSRMLDGSYPAGSKGQDSPSKYSGSVLLPWRFQVTSRFRNPPGIVPTPGISTALHRWGCVWAILYNMFTRFGTSDGNLG
jgi:hypothetical protein